MVADGEETGFDAAFVGVRFLLGDRECERWGDRDTVAARIVRVAESQRSNRYKRAILNRRVSARPQSTAKHCRGQKKEASAMDMGSEFARSRVWLSHRTAACTTCETHVKSFSYNKAAKRFTGRARLNRPSVAPVAALSTADPTPHAANCAVPWSPLVSPHLPTTICGSTLRWLLYYHLLSVAGLPLTAVAALLHPLHHTQATTVGLPLRHTSIRARSQ